MKRIYVAPQVELIQLDYEISLALESVPPVGPEEGTYLVPEYFNNEPYKTSMG